MTKQAANTMGRAPGPPKVLFFALFLVTGEAVATAAEEKRSNESAAAAKCCILGNEQLFCCIISISSDFDYFRNWLELEMKIMFDVSFFLSSFRGGSLIKLTRKISVRMHRVRNTR